MSTVAPERLFSLTVTDDLERAFNESVPCEGAYEGEGCDAPAAWRMLRSCGCPPSMYCHDCRAAIIGGILPYYEVGCVDCGHSTEPKFVPL